MGIGSSGNAGHGGKGNEGLRIEWAVGWTCCRGWLEAGCSGLATEFEC